MSGPQLFTWFRHDHRPLSHWLQDHVRRRLLAPLAAASNVDQVDQFTADLETHIDGAMPPEIRVAGSRLAQKIEGPPRPGNELGLSYPTQRWLFEVQVEGDLGMLECWPDDSPVGLPEPVWVRSDDEPTFEELRARTLPPPTAADPHPAFADMPYDTFLLSPAFAKPGDGRRLYFTIDTTIEERRAHRDSGAIQAAVDARLSYLTSMIEGTNQQVQAYRPHLRSEAAALASVLRQRLDDSETVIASISLPEWTIEPPQLEETDVSADLADAEGPDVSTHLVVPGGQRLSSASFKDILSIISGWGRGVHEYPKAFAKLVEDDLSCLLAATLKATTPGADHQVYRYGGKTDIIIRAEDLPDGLSHEPVFVCEAKKGGGGQRAAGALEKQLLERYTTNQDTAAVLLLYLKNKNLGAARTSILEALRDVDGYVRRAEDLEAAESDVMGWPVLMYRRDSRVIRVCVATIDLYVRPS